MVFLAALLLAYARPPVAATSLVELTRADCAAPTFDKEKGDIGDRAIISDDGSKVVVQCGDGVVKSWRLGQPKFTPLGIMPLFRAAQMQGIIPANLRCPQSSLLGDAVHIETDCDILDHDRARKTYVLKSAGDSLAFLVSGSRLVRESRIGQVFGSLLPGIPTRLAIVNGKGEPELLQSLRMADGATALLAQLPTRNMIFENGEGRTTTVAYAPAHQSIIVAFSGAFRVATEMTYVRAFSEAGVERWRITAKLPPRQDSLIVGDNSKLILLASGRYALFAKTSARDACDLVDLKNGTTAASLSGWPLATSRDANVVLIKEANETLSLMRLDLGA